MVNHQAGAYVDALDPQGSSPLLLAASQRDFTMARKGAERSGKASGKWDNHRKTIAGWWFGMFLVSHILGIIWNNHPN